MKPFIRLLEEAAEDESVVSIKMTLYRISERSTIIDALIEAAEAIKEYLRANSGTDPNLEFDDYFSATVETDGDKNYYALTPAAVIKQYVKDDAAIEEAAA